MGTDHRVFHKFRFENPRITVKPMPWPDYSGCSSLQEYAKSFLDEIDTSGPFFLLGASMGGMLAREIAAISRPNGLILLSSAMSPQELPRHYRLGRYFPVYHGVSDSLLGKIADSRKVYGDIHAPEDQTLYAQMLRDTGAAFLKWQMKTIVHWRSRSELPENLPVLRIHGGRDRVLPARLLKTPIDHLFPEGSHKLVINHSEIISQQVEQFILASQQ